MPVEPNGERKIFISGDLGSNDRLKLDTLSALNEDCRRCGIQQICRPDILLLNPSFTKSPSANVTISANFIGDKQCNVTRKIDQGSFDLPVSGEKIRFTVLKKT